MTKSTKIKLFPVPSICVVVRANKDITLKKVISDLPELELAEKDGELYKGCSFVSNFAKNILIITTEFVELQKAILQLHYFERISFF